MKNQTLFRLGQLVAPLSIAVTVALGFASQAGAVSLGIASDYNVFVLGDMTQKNTDSEGKVAVGGNANLENFYAGMSLPDSDSNGDVLVVGKELSFTNGTVKGDVVYGTTANVSNVTLGSLEQGTPLDFDAAGKELSELAKSLSSLSATGTKNIAYGGVTLTGSDSKLNIFNLAATDLDGVHSLNLNVTDGSTVVVNIGGLDATLKNLGININGSQTTAQRQNVIYNFYEATNLFASGVGIQGSVLAPFAHFNFDNGQLNGNLIAASLTGGGQTNRYLFNGDLPDSPEQPKPPTVSTTVPEPATLFGLGLVAAVGVVSRGRSKQNV